MTQPIALYDRIEEAAAYICNRITVRPQAGIVLGSGLGGLTNLLSAPVAIPYADIPYFPYTTVESHAGQLLAGMLGHTPVLLMGGRFHYYEGYTMDEVTFPIRVMKALGISTLFLSNAAGGMNKAYQIGDLVFIRDHINLFPEHPLRGSNDERLGPRFPDMSEPYDHILLQEAFTIAAAKKITAHAGVYIGLQGPTFETPAEYGWLHTIGGDVVGMSTVPEVIVARHAGLRVFAASIVTDLGVSDKPVSISYEAVLEAANASAPLLADIVATLASNIR